MADQPGAERKGASDFSNVWLVDRSRVERGRTQCKRARYWEYHAGPEGYGLRRKAQSLPLATGGVVHKFSEQLLKAEAWPDETTVRAMIAAEVDAYKKKVMRTGLLELADETGPEGGPEQLERVVEEQSALIAAIGWGLYRVWLPQLLAEWRPVLVEQEIQVPMPEIEGATQMLLMNRADMVLERIIDGSLAQYEEKTVGGYLNFRPWRSQWQTSPQLMLSKLSTQYHLKRPVSFCYVFAIDKGRRSSEKATGLVKQWSPFLYAYHREANPPMVEEDWQLKYEWVDEEGKNRRLGKGYNRQAVFTFPFGQPEGISSIEWWMRSLPEEQIQSQREILGPFDFQQHALDSLLLGIASEELEWQRAVWAVYDALEAARWDYSAPAVQRTLDLVVPQSQQCFQYGKPCPFLGICQREPGWDAPHLNDRFEMRRPHHQPEIDQMTARGIDLPPEQDEDEPEPE